MKKLKLLSISILMLLSFSSKAQDKENNYTEQYGHTLNIGVGIGGYSGYYGYIGHELPVLHADYEFGKKTRMVFLDPIFGGIPLHPMDSLSNWDTSSNGHFVQ